MVKSISEILNEISRHRSRNDKKKALERVRGNKAIMTILKYAFDPKIQFELPEGDPPYKPCESLDQQSRLYQEARKLYVFTKRGAPNLHPLKRESLFVDLLETIDPEDAKLMLEVKKKNIPYNGITKKLVEETFPGFLEA
jgi:hypothetical protein